MSSSSRKCAGVAHFGTMLALAMSTRGARSWVRSTPTGLPLCTSSVSSGPIERSVSVMASKLRQSRAARPLPPYTTRSSGRSATSGSRLFCSIRSAASWIHPLQERAVPRAARTTCGIRVLRRRRTLRLSRRTRADYPPRMEDFRKNLIEDDDARIEELLRSAKRVAVLGIKTEEQSGQPAFYVPATLQRLGLQIVPVPVYFPEVTTILGEKVYRKVAEVPGEIDIVDVFRRSRDVAPHLADLLAKRPRAVWLQSGIWDDQTAEALARAGVLVVQDRCLMVEFRAIR